MSFLKFILKQKLTIAIVIVHWLLLFLTSAKMLQSGVDHGGPEPTWGLFAFPLLILNSPAILIASMVSAPFYVAEDKSLFWSAVFFISLLTITLQWWLVGMVVSKLMGRRRQGVISSSLTDEK